MKLFSKEKINIGRQSNVDYLRGIAAINIILCHVGLYLGNNISDNLFTFSDIIGSEVGAPIFMILMGISISYSKHIEPNMIFKRGILLFFSGYLLSFFRSIIPLIILGTIDEWATIEAFFVVDILQFAGLTFILLSLFKKFNIKNYFALIFAIIFVIIDQFIMLPENVSINNELLIGIINLFCPITNWSCFPFLTWFIFPAFGLFFGELLTKCNDMKRLYSLLLPIGLIGTIYVYYTFYRLYPNYTSYYYGNNFYYMGLKNVLLTILIVLFLLSLLYFIDKYIWVKIKDYLTFLSKNLTTFYIISWIIIITLFHLEALLDIKCNTLFTIVLMIVILVVCSILTKLWIKIRK